MFGSDGVCSEFKHVKWYNKSIASVGSISVRVFVTRLI
jgi:hypothetical protein